MQQDSQPASQYDFIMNPDQKATKKPGRAMPNLPKPALMILAAAVALIILILLYSLVFGGKTAGTDQMVGVVGRASEISRISEIVAQSAPDTQTKNLATTTQVAMDSDSSRLTAYLRGRNIKIEAAKLNAYKNKKTDTEIQTASQNNSLAAYYTNYLKSSLGAYAQAIQSVYKDASNKARPILNDAFNNAEVILTSPQVANTNAS